MNWACWGQSLLTLAFIFGLDLMNTIITSASSSASISSSGTMETSCGIGITSRLCPRISNSSMPCCYELVDDKKIKTFNTKNSEEEKSISYLQAVITNGNLSASGSPERNEVTIVEDSLSDRDVICVSAGYSLCYYQEVMMKNNTRVCSPLRHKAVPKLEECFKWPSCKGRDVCSTGFEGLIISRPAFYICLVLATVIINCIIWVGLKKCGGKDPEYPRYTRECPERECAAREYPSTSEHRGL